MQKKLLTLILALIIGLSISATLLNVSRQEIKQIIEFKSWMNRNHKKYNGQKLYEKRYQIYCENLAEVQKHNRKYTLGYEIYNASANQFSDITKQEFNEEFIDLSSHDLIFGEDSALDICKKETIIPSQNHPSEEKVIQNSNLKLLSQKYEIKEKESEKQKKGNLTIINGTPKNINIRNYPKQVKRNRISSVFALMNAVEILSSNNNSSSLEILNSQMNFQNKTEILKEDEGHKYFYYPDSMVSQLDLAKIKIKNQESKNSEYACEEPLKIAYNSIISKGVPLMKVVKPRKESNESYPQSKTNSFQLNEIARLKIKQCKQITFSSQVNKQQELEKIVNKHPVLVTLQVPQRFLVSLKKYSSGSIDLSDVYDFMQFQTKSHQDKKIVKTLTFVIVGYENGSDNKSWILQNAWGSNWGQNGFLKIKKTKSLKQFKHAKLTYPDL